MKKLIVFLSILFIIWAVVPSSAQIKFGAMGGLNLANFEIDPLNEGVKLKNRTVLGLGCVFDYCLNGSFALRVEPMYLQKGSKLEIVGAGVEVGTGIEYKLTYIELPVMINYSIGPENVAPYIIAGMTLGFKLSSKANFTRGDYSDEKDYNDEIKSIDLGVSIGGGVNITMDNNSIFVEARYSNGLTNINNDPADPDNKIKTNGIQIFAGITFSMNK